MKTIAEVPLTLEERQRLLGLLSEADATIGEVIDLLEDVLDWGAQEASITDEDISARIERARAIRPFKP